MAEQKKDERTVRVHAREQDGIVQVKALIRHPMETGLRRDPTTGGFWPEHIITEGVVWVNGELVLEMQWSIAISRNPFIEFRYRGKKGDRIDLRLVDNYNTVFEGSGVVQ